jgi:hypothetical protein
MKNVAILGTSGRIKSPERFDTETLLQILGQNSGNLMFQFAASKLIPGEKVHLGLSDVPYNDRATVADVDVLVFPAANHLRIGADWSGLCGFFEATRKPLVILGLGAQATSHANEPDTIAALIADPHIQRLASCIRDRALFVTVRGEFTKRVCDALGIRDTIVLGCPSFLINDDPFLGQKLKVKLERLTSRPSDLRLGVTAAAPFEIHKDERKLGVERKLVSWAVTHDGLYFQQSGGANVMDFSAGRRDKVPENVQKSIAAILAPDQPKNDFYAYTDRNTRLHLSATDWMAEAGCLDLVIGTRLHGNMAAIAGGALGVVVPHDKRTNELAETMFLPSLSIDDLMASDTLYDCAERISFSADAFDERREDVRSKLRQLIDEYL